MIRVEIELSLVTGHDPMLRIPALLTQALHDLPLANIERLQVHRLTVEEVDA